jgi:hypothetical protein
MFLQQGNPEVVETVKSTGRILGNINIFMCLHQSQFQATPYDLTRCAPADLDDLRLGNFLAVLELLARRRIYNYRVEGAQRLRDLPPLRAKPAKAGAAKLRVLGPKVQPTIRAQDGRAAGWRFCRICVLLAGVRRRKRCVEDAAAQRLRLGGGDVPRPEPTYAWDEASGERAQRPLGLQDTAREDLESQCPAGGE